MWLRTESSFRFWVWLGFGFRVTLGRVVECRFQTRTNENFSGHSRVLNEDSDSSFKPESGHFCFLQTEESTDKSLQHLQNLVKA